MLRGIYCLNIAKNSPGLKNKAVRLTIGLKLRNENGYPVSGRQTVLPAIAPFLGNVVELSS